MEITQKAKRLNPYKTITFNLEKGMHIIHTLSNKYFWFRKIHKYLKYSPLSSSILYLASPYRRGAIVGAV